MFRANKVSQLIIRTLLLTTLVSTAAGSSVPDEDALRGIEAATARSSADTSIAESGTLCSFCSFSARASEHIQDIGYWAQERMGVPHEEQRAILMDIYSLYDFGTEPDRVEDGFIVLRGSANIMTQGALVHALLCQAKHKAEKHDEILQKAMSKIWGIRLLTGVVTAFLPMSSFLVKAAVAGTALLGVTVISSRQISTLQARMNKIADEAALAAMDCSQCVREASLDCQSWSAESGHLPQEAYFVRAEELEGSLCSYHNQQTQHESIHNNG